MQRSSNYRSPRREAAAAATRSAILDSALSLFAERGYQAVSVADIAEAPNVAVPTVYSSVGGKAVILAGLMTAAREAAARQQTEIRIRERADPGSVLAATVANSRTTAEEHYQTLALVMATAGSEPEVQAAREAGMAFGHSVCFAAAERLSYLDDLRPDVTVGDAATTLRVLLHPRTWTTLVQQLGRSWDDAEGWMMASTERLLFR